MLRSYLIFFVLSFNFTTVAKTNNKILDIDEGLPKEADLYLVKLPDLPNTNKIRVQYHLTLPSTQKLNPGAPSFLAVYERHLPDQKWELTEKMNLKNQIWSGQDLQLSQSFQLKSENSEVAVYSTVIHCGKDGKTPCFIQGFKGKAKRKKDMRISRNQIPFYIEGKVY